MQMCWINATPVGLYPDVDAVPPVDSVARSRGRAALDGLLMLVYQGDDRLPPLDRSGCAGAGHEGSASTGVAPLAEIEA
jgi:hypothetical protein